MSEHDRLVFDGVYQFERHRSSIVSSDARLMRGVVEIALPVRGNPESDSYSRYDESLLLCWCRIGCTMDSSECVRSLSVKSVGYNMSF